MGGAYREFTVVETNPRGPVLIASNSTVKIKGESASQPGREAHRRHLRGHRRPAQAGAAHPGDDRAAAALPGALRQAGHRAAEGRTALRPARHRQDAGRQGTGQRDLRLLHPHRRAGGHGQVLRRVGGAPAQDLRRGPGARALHPLHRRDRRRSPQARGDGQPAAGREARRRAAAVADGRPQVARPGRDHRRHQRPSAHRPGAAAPRPLRPRDQHRRAGEERPPRGAGRAHARHAAGRGRLAGQAGGGHARLRRRRPGSPLSRSRHGDPAQDRRGHPARGRVHPLRHPRQPRSDDGRLPRGASRGRAFRPARGVHRDPRREAGKRSAAWTRQSRC